MIKRAVRSFATGGDPVEVAEAVVGELERGKSASEVLRELDEALREAPAPTEELVYELVKRPELLAECALEPGITVELGEAEATVMPVRVRGPTAHVVAEVEWWSKGVLPDTKAYVEWAEQLVRVRSELEKLLPSNRVRLRWGP